MTVSTGVGGGTVGGVLVGGTGAGSGAVIRELPFTGASSTMLMLAIGLLLLIASAMAYGLSRRHSSEQFST